MLSKIKGVIKSIVEFVADVAKRMLLVVILFSIPLTLCVIGILIIDFLPPSILVYKLSFFITVLAIISLGGAIIFLEGLFEE